jgi:hypothetical protein
MPELHLQCNRPHPNAVDYDISRFVVATSAGLNVNGQRLEMGDEVPLGVLSAYALQCEYSRPPGRIELLQYAMTDPDLREAYARRRADAGDPMGSEPEPKEKSGGEEHDVQIDHEVPDSPSEPTVDLEKQSKKQLQELCERSGLSDVGLKKDLIQRLRDLL